MYEDGNLPQEGEKKSVRVVRSASQEHWHQWWLRNREERNKKKRAAYKANPEPSRSRSRRHASKQAIWRNKNKEAIRLAKAMGVKITEARAILEREKKR
jgi:hypothetical protein